jgi:hypothetical protein
MLSRECCECLITYPQPPRSRHRRKLDGFFMLQSPGRSTGAPPIHFPKGQNHSASTQDPRAASGPPGLRRDRSKLHGHRWFSESEGHYPGFPFLGFPVEKAIILFVTRRRRSFHKRKIRWITCVHSACMRKHCAVKLPWNSYRYATLVNAAFLCAHERLTHLRQQWRVLLAEVQLPDFIDSENQHGAELLVRTLDRSRS